MIILTPKTDFNGVHFQRKYQPLIGLVKYSDDYQVLFYDPLEEYGLPDAIEKYNPDIFFDCSPDTRLYADIKLCKNMGIKVILDYDDAPPEYVEPTNFKAFLVTGEYECDLEFANGRSHKWENGRTSIKFGDEYVAFNTAHNKANNIITNKLKGYADCVVTTTDYLKSKLDKYNDNITIIPNAVNCGAMSKDLNRGENKKIRIGWTLGESHYEDNVELVKNSLERLFEERDDIELVLMGNKNQVYTGSIKNVEIHDKVGMKEYHNKLKSLNLDIGICHVEDNEFNKCKSNLKAIEYGALGIPIIASHTLYDKYLVDSETALIYKSSKKFHTKINRLINDGGLRDKLASNMSNYITGKYDMETIIPKYADLFMEVLNK